MSRRYISRTGGLVKRGRPLLTVMTGAPGTGGGPVQMVARRREGADKKELHHLGAEQRLRHGVAPEDQRVTGSCFPSGGSWEVSALKQSGQYPWVKLTSQLSLK